MLAGPAADPVLIRAHHPRAEFVEDLERRLVARQAKLSPKLHGRHAGCLAGHQIGRPKPYAQRRVRARHDRSHRQSGVTAALAAAQDARTICEAERLSRRLTMGANKPVAPASLLQVGGAGRVVGKKSLELWERLWEPKIATPVNVHEHGRTLPLVVVGDNRIGKQGRTALGTTFLISLTISLWSANSGMKALFDALNIVYDVEERRNFIQLNALSLLFTLGAMGFILLSVATLVVLPAVFSVAGLGSEFSAAFSYSRWPLLLIVLILALALIYRFGPNREHPKWRWITWGSASAAFLWLVASLLFSWYAANFGSFNKTYGALGAAIGFMIWMWVSASVILAGAQLDAELESQDPSSRKPSDRSSTENIT